MPRTKRKPEPQPGPQPPAGVNASGEVLTLAEAAAYLRLPEAEVTRLAHTQALPGRFTGSEWRFLKSAIREWLSQPSRQSKEAQLAVVGMFKDDPRLDEMLHEIYKKRGRPLTEGEE